MRLGLRLRPRPRPRPWGLLAALCSGGKRKAFGTTCRNPLPLRHGQNIRAFLLLLLPRLAHIRLVAASRGNLMTLWGEGTSPETVKSLSPSGSPGHSNGAANGGANGAGSSASSNVDLEAGEGRVVRGESKLPFQPMCLTFSDVKYSVPYPKVSLLGPPLHALARSCSASAAYPCPLHPSPAYPPPSCHTLCSRLLPAAAFSGHGAPAR